MSEEQNIPGVPEGYRIINASRKAYYGEWYIGRDGGVYQWSPPRASEHRYVIVERIPKTKKWVAIAEWDLGHPNTLDTFIPVRTPDRTRIEERDV